MARLGTETAFEVLARARALEAQGKNVVHLEIGEPDFDTPANIVEAAVKALKSGYTHYGPAAGLPGTRAAIAKDFSRRRGVPVTADQVVVVPGGKPIMFFLMMALLEEGDEVVYPDPGFPIYESMVKFLGAKPMPIVLREENEFRLDLNELETKVSDRTKLVIINSPHNPTGAMLRPAEMQAIGELCAKRGCYLLSDEIYARILYDGTHETPMKYGDPERIVVLDGFSKTYAMTGWRIGYGVMDPKLAVSIARLQTNATSCTAAFTQRAAVEALEGPQGSVDEMVAEFKRRRDTIVAGLNRIPGVRCVEPRGAFYVFPNIRGTGHGSKQLEGLLLERAGVATLAGTAFGAAGEGYLRLSYANSIEAIESALDRMRRFLGQGRA